MANGKDAMKYVLSTISFSSITFLDKDIQNYWNDVIPEIKDLQTNENIENPAQRVELLFANETYYDDGSKPKIIILNNSVKPIHPGQVILETSSGEDCARLLSISHTNAQRFSMPIYLIITNQCLNENLNFKSEHIPLPPKYVIRDKTWVPDLIYAGHPALNFKRISYGNNRGPRDKAKLLIISHGKSSLIVNQLISSSNTKNNIRHLELQTLRPISNEILSQAMNSVEQIISIEDTNLWLEQHNDIKSIQLSQVNSLIC
ncbi:MAG: hypothetical protein CMA27_01915 [Euryarchaeota archaeon]|nr:hypothetical protein [Euryarchaeota archaeon]